MNSKSVLFAALSLHSTLGGIQRFNQRVVRNLSELLPEAVLRVHVLGDPLDERAVSSGVYGFAGRKAAFIAKTLLALRGAELLAIDHVALLPLAALAKLVKPRLPVLLFAHGVEVWGSDGGRPVRRFEPALMRFAVARVACVSRFTALRLQRAFRYPGARVSLLPNAVDPLPIAPPAREPTSTQTVLVVTRLSALEPYKNVDKVIAAVARLAPSMPDLRLEIVGDGDARPALVAMTEANGVSDRVRFLGRVLEGELAAAYARASVFALPSTGEGFGIAYLEAWQRGLPVIGSTEGAAPEVIEDGKDGLVVEAADTEALAGAIETLLRDDKLARRLGEAGRAKTMTIYSGGGVPPEPPGCHPGSPGALNRTGRIDPRSHAGTKER